MGNKYDLIVIGAGPGGYAAAIKTAQLGKKTLVIENREVGGTCLNRGCIPTKTLIHATEILEELENCETFGIHVSEFSYDFAKLQERKQEVVKKLRTGVEGLLKANKVEVLKGTAFIEGKGQVSCHACMEASEESLSGQDMRFEAEHILIAAGSKPLRPSIPGLDLPGVVTSDDLLMDRGVECKKLVIIGGGVIGVEFASIYHALGCEVTIIEAMERILPTLDREISQNLSMILKKRGIKIYTGARVEKVEKDEELICHFIVKEASQQVSAQNVLIAIGRAANTEGLCDTSVNLLMEHGKIPVNADFETKVRGIYAVGDVVKDGIQLAHVASAQGINAVCRMFGKEAPMNLDTIPSCVYTNPEIATAGITQKYAKEQNIPVVTGKALMSANPKTVIVDGDRGFMKLIFHEDTKVLLGAQLMCQRATDMIGGLADAINQGLTAEQLKITVRPHPTFCEAIGEAIENAIG